MNLWTNSNNFAIITIRMQHDLLQYIINRIILIYTFIIIYVSDNARIPVQTLCNPVESKEQYFLGNAKSVST